jgi:hypothetical protein
MHKFKFSYQADSTNETVFSIKALDIDMAIELAAIMKRLSKQEVVDLFNIKKD